MAPSSIGEFVKQRVRWYRGFLQTLIKHKNRLRGFKRVDMLMTLLTPTFAALALPGFVLTLYHTLEITGLGDTALMSSGLGIVYFLCVMLAILLLFALKLPEKTIYAPVAFVTLILESLTSIYAHLLELLRRPREWTKTKRA